LAAKVAQTYIRNRIEKKGFMSFEVLLIAQVKGESESGMSDLFGFSNLPVSVSR
jgi:hypothetical protein